MNNNDKINILKEAAAQYYNNELALKEKLDIKAAKKLYDEYEEIINWLEDLKEIKGVMVEDES
jgi:hypothetical protein